MTDYSQINVLVVEDSGVTLGMEIEILKEIGFANIAFAKDGEEAIRILRKEPDIRLIISDWNMPIRNGYDLLVWVRACEKLKETPFVMATAHGERRQAAKALEAGVTEFITKPYSAGELRQVVDRVLGFETGAVREPVLRKPAPGKTLLRAAHIQITDHLILGVLADLANKASPAHFELETVCMPSWNPVREALETGEADVAFLLAPIAMDMYASGSGIRLTLFAHKNGSTCVRKKGDMASMADFFNGKTFYIPHILSVHHILSDMFFRELGLKPGLVGKAGTNVFFEVVPPVMMPEFLTKSQRAGGFMVAEPIGASTVASDKGELLYLSGEVWENHPCCVVVMRDDFINAHEKAAYEFTRLLVEAGGFVTENPKASAKIGVGFLDPDGKIGLSAPILEKVLREPAGIKTDDLLPEKEPLELIQRYMASRMGIGTLIDLDGFLDMRFANAAYRDLKMVKKPSVFHGPAHIVKKFQESAKIIVHDGSAKILFRDGNEPRPPSIVRATNHQISKSVFEKKEGEASTTFTISSESEMVNRVVHDAREFMTRYGIDSCSECIRVLNELLANAVRHGNGNRAEKRIFCEISYLGDLLFKFTVEDQGNGFDYQKVGEEAFGDLRHKQTGYAFVKAFAEQIEFNGKGNRVSVYIKIQRQTAYVTWDENDLTVIRPSDNITAASVGELKKILLDFVESGRKKYRFDFEHVDDIDSVSLTVFVVLVKMLAKRDMDADTELEIVNGNDNIANLFNLTRLNKHYLFI